MNSYRQRLSLLVVVFALLLFSRRTAQLTVTSCDIRTLALVNSSRLDAQAPTPLYSTLLQGWQALFNSSVESGRFFSLLLGLLTLALLYRLAADLWGLSIARWTILLAGTAEVTMRLSGWVSIYSWTGLLTVLTTWLLRRSIQSRRRTTSLGYGVAYTISLLLLIASHQLAWIVLAFHLVCLFVMVRRPLVRTLLAIGLLLLIFLARSLIGAPDSVSGAGLLYLLPPIVWASWVFGLCAVLLHLVDQRQRPGHERRAASFLAAWLIVPVIAWFITPLPDQAVSLLLVMPSLIAVMYGLSIVSLRGRLVLAAVGILAFVPIIPVPGQDGGPVLQSIREQNGVNIPVVLDLSGDCFGDSNVLDQLYRGGMTLYVALDKGWGVVGPEPIRFVDSLPELNTAQEWRVEPLPEQADVQATAPLATPSDAGHLLTFRHNYTHTRLSLYELNPPPAVAPTHEVVYRYGPLALLSFTVLPGTSTAPGSTLVVRTWWSASDKADDNYILNAELINGQGMPIAGSSSLIGQSFTRNWSADSAYIDQQLIDIPTGLATGQYNLVVSVHGSDNATHIPVKLINGRSVGEFGYLTTVTVGNP